MEEKCSNSFSYYVDPIFVIQNDLLRFTYKTKEDSITQMSLSSKADEDLLLLGICKKLVIKIQDEISFEDTKKSYKHNILKLCNKDLDYIEFKNKKQELDKALLNHAKLIHCIENYFDYNNFGNTLYMAGLLISMYACICNKLKTINPNKKIPTIRNTKLYKYVKDANLEQCIDISNYTKFSFFTISEIIFNHLIDCEYNAQNAVVQPMLVTVYNSDKDRIGVKQENASIFVLDDNSTEYKEFKRQNEQDVYDWLVGEMHTLPNGKIF